MGLDTDAISATLFSIHIGLSTLLKAPELALAPEESEAIAKATAAVAEHYDMAASAKTVAWGNLIVLAVMTYGPRAVLMSQRTKAEKAAARAANPMAAATARPAQTNGAGATIPGTNLPIMTPANGGPSFN